MRLTLILSLLIIALSSTCQSEEGFIARESFGKEITNGNDLIEMEDGSFLLFNMGKNPYHPYQNYHFYRINPDLSYQFLDSLDLNQTLIAFYPKLIEYDDGIYLTNASSSSGNLYIFSFDAHSGKMDIHMTIEKLEDKGQSFWRQVKVSNSISAWLYLARRNGTVASGIETSVMLIQNKEIIKTIPVLFPTSAFEAFVPESLTYTSQNTLIVGGRVTVELGPNSHNRLYLAEYTLEGQLLWKYIQPSGQEEFLVRQCNSSADGKALTLIGLVPGGTKFMKIDKEATEIIQYSEICPDEPFIIEHIGDGYNGMIVSHEEDGYILYGKSRKIVEEHCIVAVMAKITFDGDCIWHRSYSVANTDYNTYEIRSLRKTMDNGYIGTGRFDLLYTSQDTVPFSATLLLKVDQEGYVTRPSSTNEIAESSEISLYPTVSSDIIYIEQKADITYKYQVYDMNGCIVDSFSNHDSSNTMMLSVHNYPTGQYILNYQSLDMKHSESLKFIVQR